MKPSSSTSPATPFPRTHATYLTLTEQARNQVAVTRSFIAPHGSSVASPTPSQLQFALADGHEAIGKLWRASALLEAEIPARWSSKAATHVATALGEITRMREGKVADTPFAVKALEQAIHDIDLGRRMLISPPSNKVFDGS
jgi:hypothetical protein